MDLSLFHEKINSTCKNFEDLSYMLFTYFEPFTCGSTYDEEKNKEYHELRKMYNYIRKEIDNMLNIAKKAVHQENIKNGELKTNLELLLHKNHTVFEEFKVFSRGILVPLSDFTFPYLDEEKAEKYYKAQRLFHNFREQFSAAYHIVLEEEKLQRNKVQENKPNAFVNSFGEATQRYITSSTYERQQNRLSKEIMNRLK